MFHKAFENKMYKEHREKILMSLDLCIVLISYVLASWIKNDFQLSLHMIINASTILTMMLIILLIYALSFYIFKVYKSLWKYIGVDELLRLTLSSGFATVIIMLGSMVYFNVPSLVSVEFIAGIFSLILMAGLRVGYRMLRRIEMQNGNDVASKRVIIIGAGDAGNLLLKELAPSKLCFSFKSCIS